MLAAPGIIIAKCSACGLVLIKNERVVKPHHELAFGVHPDEIRQWDLSLSTTKIGRRFCLNHPVVSGLMTSLSQVLPYRIIGLDMPDYIPWLGHWITGTKLAPEFNLLFNIQMAQRQFLDILCLLPTEFSNLSTRAKIRAFA